MQPHSVGQDTLFATGVFTGAIVAGIAGWWLNERFRKWRLKRRLRDRG